MRSLSLARSPFQRSRCKCRTIDCSSICYYLFMFVSFRWGSLAASRSYVSITAFRMQHRSMLVLKGKQCFSICGTFGSLRLKSISLARLASLLHLFCGQNSFVFRQTARATTAKRLLLCRRFLNDFHTKRPSGGDKGTSIRCG